MLLKYIYREKVAYRKCRAWWIFFFLFFGLKWTFLLFIYLFIIYLWLRWVFVSVRGLSPVAASGGHSSSRCAGLSLSRPLLLRSTGSRRASSVVVAHGPSCSAACGIFPDQGSNPCPLHWQADSQPLRHQGSPWLGEFLHSETQLHNQDRYQKVEYSQHPEVPLNPLQLSISQEKIYIVTSNIEHITHNTFMLIKS